MLSLAIFAIALAGLGAMAFRFGAESRLRGLVKRAELRRALVRLGAMERVSARRWGLTFDAGRRWRVVALA
jgi:hypothetical protein